MRKAKTPPKRKPVPAGRRPAKAKAAKAKAPKVAKAGSGAKGARKKPRPVPNLAKPVAPARKGEIKAEAKKASAGVKATPAVAKVVAKSAGKGAGKIKGPGGKDARTAGATDHRATGPARSEGAGSAGAVATERPAEPAAPPGLPTPIASFII